MSWARREVLTKTMAILGVSAIVGTIVIGAAGLALANGGKSKRIAYRRTLAGPDSTRSVEFDAELEPLMFRLTSVGDRYRVVRIRIVNRTRRRSDSPRAATWCRRSSGTAAQR